MASRVTLSGGDPFSDANAIDLEQACDFKTTLAEPPHIYEGPRAFRNPTETQQDGDRSTATTAQRQIDGNASRTTKQSWWSRSRRSRALSEWVLKLFVIFITLVVVFAGTALLYVIVHSIYHKIKDT